MSSLFREFLIWRVHSYNRESLSTQLIHINVGRNYIHITLHMFPVHKDKRLYAHSYSAKLSFITKKGCPYPYYILTCAISQTIPEWGSEAYEGQNCANNIFLTIIGHCLRQFSGPLYCRSNLNNHVGGPPCSCHETSTLNPCEIPRQNRPLGRNMAIWD